MEFSLQWISYLVPIKDWGNIITRKSGLALLSCCMPANMPMMKTGSRVQGLQMATLNARYVVALILQCNSGLFRRKKCAHTMYVVQIFKNFLFPFFSHYLIKNVCVTRWIFFAGSLFLIGTFCTCAAGSTIFCVPCWWNNQTPCFSLLLCNYLLILKILLQPSSKTL